MAKDICLDTRVMEQIADRLAALASNMDSLGGRLGNIRLPEEAGGNLRLPVNVRLKSTGSSYGGSGNLNSTLRNLSRAMKALSSYTDKVSDHVQAAADDLADLERTMARMYRGDNLPEIWRQRPLVGAGAVSSKGGSNSVFAVEYEKIGLFVSKTSAFLNLGKHAFSLSQRLTPFSSKTTYKSRYGNWSSEGETYLGIDSKVLDVKLAEHKRPEVNASTSIGTPKTGKDYDQEMSLLHVGAGMSQSSGYNVASVAFENDRGSFDAKMNVGTKESHAVANAGLFTYKVTGDGQSKRVFAPGAKVDIGKSYTMMESTVSGEYELIDNVKVSGSGSLKTGHVGGNAKGELGLVDGKWVASGELSAEAILAGAEGDVSLDVVGLKGTLGGTLDVGVGAHARGGYKDGVLSFDVGASFLVGASVSAELDVGGFVENVSKGLEKICKDAKSIVSGASKTVGGWFGWNS